MERGTETVDRTGLEVLTMPECMRLVGTVPVGRMAMIDRGEIVVFPVNHVIDQHVVAFRTAYGAKMEAALMRHVVSFEADAYDAEAHTGWSVVIKGRADLVTDDEDLARLEASGLRPWSNPVARDTWVVIRATEVSGRRILPSDADQAQALTS
jgi:nitroimidazol reductase NimA-like FMN-containing flavoprotein (pyridoxamine 5'-phosphate oxidase superfamily)